MKALLGSLKDVMGSTLSPGLEKTFNKTFKDVPSHLCLDTKQMKPFVKKYKDKLLSERRYENDMFTRDVRSKNLLSFLYLFDGDGKSAKEESEKLHAGDSSSVVGLVTKILIAYKNNDICSAKEMVTTLNEMIKSPDWEVIKLKGKAEIGFCNAYFCPFLIPSAVDILKDGVNKAPDSLLSKIPMDLKVLWNYELAHAYKIQLANSDARSQSMSFDLNAVFGEFMRLSLAVIKSGDTWLTARALVDLADGFVRSETQEGWIKGTKLPDNMTTESCMKQAATTNPRDPHVMEKCGIFLKQKANSVDQFEEAIQNLNKAVALNESRHVALHHLALAFIAIWHINSDHKEKWLYVNQVRKKKQKPRSSSNRNQAKTVTAKLSNEAKMEHRGPFRFGKLKSNITRDKDEKSPSHELLKAKEYMERACEINSTSALYRIDLARICFSLYQDDQACLNLDKAAGVENMSEYDKSYLYEQYGLILYHPSTDLCNHYAAKGYYQLSVRASMQMKKHSRIAFYELEQLLNILCVTAESQEEEKECTEELYHIYKLIERFEEAEMYIHVDDPERLWKFIDMKHRRNKNSDAYTLLLPQLDVESSNTERRGLIFQVAIGATREQSFENSAAPHVSQDIFRRLFAWHFNATDQNEVEYDVALITDPDGDDYSQHTEDIMETIHAIGLKVSHDVGPNESVFSLIGKSMKAHCVSILIESEQISTSFMAVIEELRSKRKEDRLRVITAGGLEARHIPSPLESVSTLGMEEFSKESLFCLLCKCTSYIQKQ